MYLNDMTLSDSPSHIPVFPHNMDNTTSSEPKLESIVPPPNGVHSLDLAYCFIRCLELEISRPKFKFLPLACNELLLYNIKRYSDVKTTVAKVKRAARHTEDWESQDKYIVDIKALETSLKEIVEKFESTPKEALLRDVVAGHSPPLDSYEASFCSLRKLRDAIDDFGNRNRENGCLIFRSSIMGEYIDYILQSIECIVESCFTMTPICTTDNMREAANSKEVSEKFGRLKDRIREEPAVQQEHMVEYILRYLLALTKGYYSGYESSESFVAEVKCRQFDSYLNAILQLFNNNDTLCHMFEALPAHERDKRVKLLEISGKFDTAIMLILQKSITELFVREIHVTVQETLASLINLGTSYSLRYVSDDLDLMPESKTLDCFGTLRMELDATGTRSVKIKVPPALAIVLPDVQRPFFEECIEYSRICRELTDVYDLKKRTDSLAINLQGFVEQAYRILKKAKTLSVPLTELSHGRTCALLFWPLKNRLTRLRVDTPEFSEWDKAIKAVDEARERDMSTFRELRMRMTYLFGENTAIPATESDQEVDETEGRWCDSEEDGRSPSSGKQPLPRP